MKFTKTLIAAALLASAGVAQASFNASDEILTIVDTTNSSTYYLDLGVTPASLQTSPSLNLTINGSSDANFASFVSGLGSSDNVFYRVDGAYTYNFVTTFVDNSISSYYTNNSNGVTAVLGTVASIQNDETIAAAAAGAGNSAYVANGGTGYAGASTNANNQEGSFVNSAAIGTNLNLWEGVRNSKTSTTELNLGTVDLTIAGTGTSAVGSLTIGTASAVPLPTTAWMFLSGVVGLLSVKRRKNAAV